ncbi:MAG: rRNA maturation RNase YbeY [Chloroflexota bacterium]|nr:rRNA maturation RNase YbeY [Chloroflexota bacterium]
MISPQVEVVIRPAFANCVSMQWLKDVVETVLQVENRSEGAELTLLITDDDEIRALNRRFRGTDRPTDVLAFGGSGEESFVIPEDFALYLGDIVVSYPRAVAQAESAGHSIKEELALLIIHGCLHLLGYEDVEEQERRVMWHRQEEIKDGFFADG